MNHNYLEYKEYTTPSVVVLELIMEQTVLSGSTTIDDLLIYDLD